MNISSVSLTAAGHYRAVTDQGIYTIPPDSTNEYAQAVDAWIAAGNTPTPYDAQAALQSLRDQAAAVLDELQATGSMALRAIVIESLIYANAQRAAFNILLTWLGGQGTLAQRGQLASMALVEATPAQAKAAIAARIVAGEAD